MELNLIGRLIWSYWFDNSKAGSFYKSIPRSVVLCGEEPYTGPDWASSPSLVSAIKDTDTI